MSYHRGSAYLFAAIIVMTVGIMLVTTLQITGYSAALSFSAVNNDDLYYLAADAAELLTAELNDLLYLRLGKIEKRVNELFEEKNIKENITDYVSYDSENNQFCLKQKDPSRTKAGERNTLYSSYFIKAAEEILYADIEKLIRSVHKWRTNEREISAEFWREKDSKLSAGVINIEVTAREPLTGAMKIVTARVALSAPEHEEIIFEHYEFQDRPDYLQARQGGITLSAEGFTGETALPEFLADGGGWSEETPVFFAAGGETVDVDLFRGIPSIIIVEGDALLSGGVYDFSGLIYASGKIIIEEGVSIRGAVAAGEVAAPDSGQDEDGDSESERDDGGLSENISVIYEDNFFDIKISDRELRSRVYDYLGLTNFFGRTGGYINRTEQLKTDVLKHLKLSPDFGLAISAVPEFTILTLQ